MDVIKQLCIKKVEIIADNGDCWKTEPGRVYITTVPTNDKNEVMVFSDRWVTVPKEHFKEINAMKIDIPQDPKLAYEEGWRDAVRFLNLKCVKYIDDVLVPKTLEQTKQIKEINKFKSLLDMASDIQAAYAWYYDNKY